VARKNGLTKTKIIVDERTAEMTADVLACRGFLRHSWDFVPMGPKRRAELAGDGQVEVVKVCSRCGTDEKFLYNVRERTRVTRPRRHYPKGYLIPREYAGSGRLPQGEAFVAQLVREKLI
jgi:hypothetical protein